MSQYLYYQLTGGEEQWTLIQQEQSREQFSQLKPTFVTVLSLDKILSEKPDRELLESVKYMGPMYFDLDDKDNVQNSINDARLVIADLLGIGVAEADIHIYLSGKKGIHILIPPEVFMGKPEPTRHLPHIYKEIAMKYSQRSVDMKVYTARKGRMLRTCWNIRENGNYRVPVTVAQLNTMDTAGYKALCIVPVADHPWSMGRYAPKMALVYEEAAQKYKTRPRKAGKPVTPLMLKQHEPVALAILQGRVSRDAGFNKIAIQICLYAREAGWKEDELLKHAEGLIRDHKSDGDRYNSPDKRERALIETFYYVEDNPSYEYSLGGMRSVGEPREAQVGSMDGEHMEESVTTGIQVVDGRYVMVRTEDDKSILSNFIFAPAIKLLDPVDDTIRGFEVKLIGDSTVQGEAQLTLYPNTFTGNSSLHNALAPYGAVFTGTDSQARGLYQLMLRQVETNKYVLDTEGLNVINLPNSPNPVLRKKFIAWVDSEGVQIPPELAEQGVQFEFQGYPEVEGVIKTDLTKSPNFSEFMARDDAKARIEECFTNLFACHDADVIGKTLGWSIACFWRQLFHEIHSKFPLLHVYGPAGSGKTELVQALQSLFGYQYHLPGVTPNSTPFALLQLMGGSASIPVLLDEYKATMNRDQLEKYRAIFRDAYNMKDTQRGGGSARKDAFNALNRMALSAPVAFVAESMETETAIVERVVLVPIKKKDEYIGRRHYAMFQRFLAQKEVLSVFGHLTAARILKHGTIEHFALEFNKLYTWAQDTHMLRPGDVKLVESGEMADDEYQRRAGNRQRNVYNNSVALFGLYKLKVLLKIVFKDDFDRLFGEAFENMEVGVFLGSDALARSTVPEYIKVLSSMADLTMTRKEDYRLLEGDDYNLQDVGGQVRLVINWRIAFNKYRAYQRWIGSLPMYSSEAAFYEAMVDSPQYMHSGQRTERIKSPTLVFNYAELVRNRMLQWQGKPKTIPE